MKQQAPKQRRAFWGKCLKLWLICWVAYCACEFLMLRLFFSETMPHLRDYSILGRTQHLVFAAVYYLIFTKPACRLTPLQPEGGLYPLRAVGEFFRRDWRQILLLAGCAVLYEVAGAVFPDSNNLFSALLAVLFPSVTVIHTPVRRTLIAVSLSLASMLLPHIFLRYRDRRRNKAEKCGNDTSAH